MSKREAVSAILVRYDIDPEPPTNVYIDRIENRTPFPEPLDVDTLIRYLITSIKLVDEDTRRAKQELYEIIEGESTNYLGQNDWEAGKITELQSEELMFGFEAFAERKIDRGEMVTIEDFKRYSAETGVPLEKVLYACPWREPYVDEETLFRVYKARVSITGVE